MDMIHISYLRFENFFIGRYSQFGCDTPDPLLVELVDGHLDCALMGAEFFATPVDGANQTSDGWLHVATPFSSTDKYH